MNDTHSQEDSTALISPGDDYELKHILNVAAAYLDAGKVDDAEDLLHEAIEVGAKHPDVDALARRLDHARGRPGRNISSEEKTLYDLPDVLVNFTRPLPGVETQTPVLQRLVREAEGHYAAKRLSAALDSTVLACVEAPGFMPGFVRLAEIQLALGKRQQARDLFTTLSYWHEVHEQETDWLLQSLHISLNPDDTRTLAEYAQLLLSAEGPTVLEPYVPQAISRTIDESPDVARSLSEQYIERRPSNLEVQRLHLRVLMRSGDVDAFTTTTQKIVVRSSSVDLLVLRAIAESIASSSDEWISWVEAVAIALRADGSASEAVQAAIQDSMDFISPQRFALLSAAVAFSSARWQECADTLRATASSPDSETNERFVLHVMLAIALHRLNDPSASTLMLDAVKLAFHPEIETFARSTDFFGVSVAAADLLKASAGGDGNSIDKLTNLRDTNPHRLELRSALADLHSEAGNPHEAVRELRHVAQEHERSGNLPEMVQAMRRISEILPGNVEIKAKLIEGFLRRGVLDEAIKELGNIGELYLERDRVPDAVAAFTRGAEIASATGAFPHGNELFRKAVSANPDDLPVRHAAVAFYLQTGSIAQATQELREVVRIALYTEDRDEAVAALHQIIALAPEDPDAYHQLGEVLTSLGEYTQAERVYRRLATFSPEDPVLEAKQSALAVLAATK